MSVIDTLEILITADATGIDKILKSVIQTVTGSVDKMNKEEVDWTSIFTRAVSPAIISGVASMFALAISQLVNFNNAATNLSNEATPATDALSNSMGLVSDQVTNLAYSSGRSVGDVTDAFNEFTKAGLDGAAATDAVSRASLIAYDSHESLSTVVTQLSTLFNNWGVKTMPQVEDALTGLVNAAHNGDFTFNELLNTLSDTSVGSTLKAKTNIASVSEQLALLSKDSGLSKDDIKKAFDGIVAAAGGTMPEVTATIGDVGKQISAPGGLIDVFGKMVNFIQSNSPLVGQALLKNMSIDPSIIADFKTVMPDAIATTGKAYDDLLKNHIIPLDDYLKTHEPMTGKLLTAWNDFATWITSTFSGVIGTIKTDFDSLGDAMNSSGITKMLYGINDESNKLFGNAKWGDLIKAVSSYASGANQALFQGGVANYLYDMPNFDEINKKLTSAGISSDMIDYIDYQGSQSQSSLVSALTEAIQKAGSSNYTNITSKFNLTIPKGSNIDAPEIANLLAKQLYNQFQGTK